MLEAMDGKKGVIECTFVKSNVTDAAYFATPVRLGRNGMEENLGIPPLSPFEKKKLEEVQVISILLADVLIGHVMCRHFLSSSKTSRKEKSFKLPNKAFSKMCIHNFNYYAIVIDTKLI